MSTPAWFNIQHGPSLPWAMIAPFEDQAQRNHSQSLQRLHDRGGLGCCEAVAVLECRRYRTMPDAKAVLTRLLQEYEANSPDLAAGRFAALDAEPFATLRAMHDSGKFEDLGAIADALIARPAPIPNAQADSLGQGSDPGVQPDCPHGTDWDSCAQCAAGFHTN